MFRIQNQLKEHEINLLEHGIDYIECEINVLESEPVKRT